MQTPFVLRFKFYRLITYHAPKNTRLISSTNVNRFLLLNKPQPIAQNLIPPYTYSIRNKKKKAQAIQEEENEDEEIDDATKVEFEDDDPGKDYKDIVVNSFNLRADNVIKMSNNMSKKKVDENFLEGKIYLNGKILTKKAYEVNPNDEIDLIVGTNQDNSEELTNVNRFFILTIKGEKNKIGQFILHVRRFKNLAVPKYQ